MTSPLTQKEIYAASDKKIWRRGITIENIAKMARDEPISELRQGFYATLRDMVRENLLEARESENRLTIGGGKIAPMEYRLKKPYANL